MAASDVVVIQDLVVINQTPPAQWIFINDDGEVQESSEELINTIHGQVRGLLTETAQYHATNFCDSDGNLNVENLNKITRLITNEFYFYTKRPLARTEFETLLQKIVNDAKTQSENIHLMLATFSVQATSDSFMNVTAHIECGPSPKVHLIVKNYASILDVNYHDKKEKRSLKLVNIKEPRVGLMRNTYLEFIQFLELTPDELQTQFGVVIDGINYPFTFNNVMPCQTAGGISFYTCLDVCFDNYWGIAKLNINELLSIRAGGAKPILGTTPGPLFVSHIITSCSTSPVNKIGLVTQADLKFSVNIAKEGAEVLEKKVITDNPYNTLSDQMLTQPIICDHLLGYAINENNLPLVACLIEEGVDINLPVKFGMKFIKPIHLAIEMSDCNFHIRSELPTDLQSFAGSYILIQVNYMPKNLYYIEMNGEAENVAIIEWDIFKLNRR